MRNIVFHKETKTFHLYNDQISYIMCVLENGPMGQIYYGKKIHDKKNFSYLVEKIERPMTSYVYEGDKSFSLEHMGQRTIVILQLKYYRKMEAESQNLNMTDIRFHQESQNFRGFRLPMQSLKKKR